MSFVCFGLSHSCSEYGTEVQVHPHHQCISKTHSIPHDNDEVLSRKERVGHNFGPDPRFPLHEGEREGEMITFINMANPLRGGIHPGECVSDGLV